MRFNFFILTFLFLPFFLFPQSGGSERLYTLTRIEIFGLNNLSEAYLKRYFTFKTNETYSISELEKVISLTIAKAESDPVINFLYTDYYVNENGTVEISVEVLEKTFSWTFFGGDAFAKIGKYNLLGPGSLLSGSVGYNLQKIEVDIPVIGGSLWGFSAETGHKLINHYEPSLFLSRFQTQLSPYIEPVPSIRIGVQGTYRHYVKHSDKTTPYEIALGGFLNFDFTYWQTFSPFALTSSTNYHYVASGRGEGTHLFSTEEEVDIKISDGFHITVQGFLAVQSTDQTVELLYSNVPGDKNSGTNAWRGSLLLPLRLLTFGKKIEQDIGLMPQLHIGAVSESFSLNNRLSIAVGGGPYYDIGIPVGIRISPEFYYEIASQSFAFHLNVNFLK